MNDDTNQTKADPKEFDFSKYPPDVLFHERRNGRERRNGNKRDGSNEGINGPPGRIERRARKERRRRIDPTTFEKQYTDDEMEFMNAMQRFKELSGKPFPTHGEVLKIASQLGYRKLVVDEDDSSWRSAEPDEPTPLQSSSMSASGCTEIASSSLE
jgi:hypothetical protein